MTGMKNEYNEVSGLYRQTLIGQSINEILTPPEAGQAACLLPS